MPQVNSCSWSFNSVKFILTLALMLVSLNYIENSSIMPKKNKTLNFYMLI